MFVPCPHCGFLIALIVADGGPPQRCPRCDAMLQADAAQAPERPGPTAEPAITPDDTRAVVSDGHGGAGSPGRDTDGSAPLDTCSGNATQSPADDPGDATEEHLAARDPGWRGTNAPIAGPATAPLASDPVHPAGPATETDRSTSPSRRARTRSAAPSFARTIAPRRRSGPRWPGLLAITALSLVLALQLALAQRAELAASARWRPLIGGLCDALRCTLPPWHEPGAWTMLARSVQPAAKDGVLQVQASFRNDAHWAQPWPLLVLSLSDVNGRTVAQRAFAPHDYRGADGDVAAELAPGQSASVSFQVAEPETAIVAFSFGFR